MEFIGVGKVIKDDDGQVTERRLVVEMTEAEADMITGVAGKPHITGRYEPGVTVNITAIYEKVKRINVKHTEILAAAAKLKADADDIANSIPLTEG